MQSSSSASSSTTSTPALRRLEWPEPSRVDLTSEFRWILHDDEAEERGDEDQDAASECRREQEGSEEATRDDDDAVRAAGLYQRHQTPTNLDGSPYRQQLQRQKEAHLPLSPAQRAAKKILQLKLELGCIDSSDCESLDDPELAFHSERLAHDQVNNRADDGRLDRATRKKPAKVARHVSKESAMSTTGDISKSRSPGDRSCQKLKRGARNVPSSPTKESAKRANKNSSSSSPLSRGKKQKRPETKESRELRGKQQRLAEWISNDDPSAHRRHREVQSHAQYSVEVESRIHSAMAESTGEGLWRDPVASLIASEMTSESVFGGFVPTRRLAFPTSSKKEQEQPLGKAPNHHSGMQEPAILKTCLPLEASVPVAKASPIKTLVDDEEGCNVPIPVSSTMVQDRALEIREQAQRLVQVGNIEDALATLQDGITQLLFDFQDNQDEIQKHGFNYSEHAHNCATRLQLKYRARHRDRVRKLALLQRLWRRHHARTRLAEKKQYHAVNAQVIQRHYKQHYERNHREQAAIRIQKCFRIYEEQRHLIHLHQACRMLVNGERRKREEIRRRQALKKRTWFKLRMVLKLLGLWRARCRATTCIQKHWKGSHVRADYAKLLAKKSDDERERQIREDAFVLPRLERALAHYREFIRSTSLGKEHVAWQMNKPWIRFERMRAEENWRAQELKAKVQAVCGILVNERRMGPRRVRVLGYLLGIDVMNLQLQQNVDANIDTLSALFGSPATAATSPGDETAVLPHTDRKQWLQWWLAKQRMAWTRWWHARQTAWHRHLLLLYWYACLWPMSYVFDRRSHANKQRAREALERQQRFVLLKVLRRLYRRLDPARTSPRFACAHCYEAFATAHSFNTHSQTCKAAKSDEAAEWGEVSRDLAFLQTKKKQKSATQQHVPELRIPPQTYTNFSTFQFDASAVKHVRAKWKIRGALRVLVEMVLCCALSVRNGVVNLESETIHASNLDKEEGTERIVALELIAYLFLLLQGENQLHPLALAQLYAFMDWECSVPPSYPCNDATETHASTWVSEDELLARLLLKPPQQRSWRGIIIRSWTEAKLSVVSWWQLAKTWPSRFVSSSKYHHPHGSAPSATVLPVA